MTSIIPEPADMDVTERARWDESRLRRRMLTGAWEQDLLDRVRKSMGPTRTDAMGEVDLSSNVFAQVSGGLATLYDVPPEVTHPDPEAQRVMRELLKAAGWVSRMQTTQRLTIGIRDMVVRPSAQLVGKDPSAPIERRVQLTLRDCYPDTIVATPNPDVPDQLGVTTEVRRIGDKWVFERLDPEIAQVTRQVHGERDVTPLEWTWFDEDGKPINPYTAYHAQVQYELWDAYTWRELVVGTLQAGVLWTFFGHSMRQASWPQRYAVDAEPAGDNETNGRRVVVADPATVLIFRRTGEDGEQPILGQWAAGADPDKILHAVAEYERRLSQFAGIPASDVLRMSGDPRSGYALALSRQGKIDAAKRYVEAFIRSDRRFLSTVAASVNALIPDSLPTSGWDVTYGATVDLPQDVSARQTPQPPQTDPASA